MLSLEATEKALEGIVGAILQRPPRYVSRIVSAASGKVTGVAAAAGVTGLVGALATASTGTAIASLSGAAATTAKLYWIGTLIGGGVAAGGMLLGGFALGAGVLGAWGVRRGLNGKTRRPEDLQEHEAAIVGTCTVILKSIKEQRELGKPVTSAEASILVDQALSPLVVAIRQAMTRASIREADLGPDIAPFSSRLAPLSLLRLRRSTDALAKAIAGAS